MEADTRDEKHPYNWPESKKWRITLTACFVAFLAGINSTAIAPAATAINERFSISDESFPFSFFPITAWTVGAAVFPVAALPLMERFGVRPGYLLSYGLFILFVIPQAVAQNFATLVVTRVFAGCFGGVLQNAIDGVAADLWGTAAERSLPLTCYIFSLLAGVTFGPVYGAAVLSGQDWRWIFYSQLIIFGATFPLLWLLLDETRPDIVLSKSTEKASGSTKQVSKLEDAAAEVVDIAGRAVRLLSTSPVLIAFTAWSSFSFGIVFISSQSIAQVFSSLYAFSDIDAGIAQASLLVGEALGLPVCVLQNHIFATRGTDRRTGEVVDAETLLYMSIPASFVGLTGGLFMYGWSSFADVHWIVPCIGLALEGVGIMVIVQAVSTYITNAYPDTTNSAIAAVAFGENVFAAFLPLAAQSMYTTLDFNWASSLLGFLALLLSFAPLVLVVFGQRIRAMSGR